MANSGDEILEDIRIAIASGNYVFKKHAMLRVVQRGISVEDAKNGLRTGRITGERWNDQFQTTDFSIEGKG